MDLTDADEVMATMEQIERDVGRLDLLLLNASGGLERGMAEDYAMQLNLHAQVRLLDGALPLMGEVAGDRFAHIELNTLLQRLVVTDDAHQAAEEFARQRDMTTAEALETPWALIGSVDRVADTLRERFGLSYWVVHDRFMDAFAPVVARLAGS